MVLDFIPHRSEAQMRDIPIDVAPLLVIGWLLVGWLLVTLVDCGKTAGRIEMKFGDHVGTHLGHIVLKGTHCPRGRGQRPPQILGTFSCGQTTARNEIRGGVQVA